MGKKMIRPVPEIKHKKMISPEMLRFFPLFAKQNNYMLKEIAMLSVERELEPGDWLFRQDDPALWFYVIVEGALSLALVLHMNGSGEHIERMGVLGRGEVLGWSSLVSPFVYTLGAQAERKSKVIEIEAAGLRELIDDNPKYGYYLTKNLAEVISERLRFKCIQLLSLKVEHPSKVKANQIEKTKS
jgi:CRP-like cAMP-binding protein